MSAASKETLPFVSAYDATVVPITGRGVIAIQQ